MLFNGLLAEQDIEGDVLVLRHTPAHRDGELKVFLPTIAAEQPELFNAYQQTQNKAVEGKMLKAKYVASFIGLEKQQAVFGTFCQLCLRDGHVSGGAARGIRTPDPIITNDVLYQLSYCGAAGALCYRWADGLASKRGPTGDAGTWTLSFRQYGIIHPSLKQSYRVLS